MGCKKRCSCCPPPPVQGSRGVPGVTGPVGPIGPPGPGPSNVYDYIIVGAGTAAATLALDLSNNGNPSILILDAGRNNEEDPDFTLSANADTGAPLANGVAKFVDLIAGNQDFSKIGERNIGAGGRGWGGCSSHNFLQAVRPSPNLFDTLATFLGDTNWNYTNAIPLLEEIETFSGPNVAPFVRGFSGPIKIYNPAALPPGPPTSYPDDFATALVNAAVVAAFSPGDAGTLAIVSDYNSSVNNGTNPSNQMFCYQDMLDPTQFTRSYAGNDIYQTMVDLAGRGLAGRNVTLLSNSMVNRVNFVNKVAVSVVALVDGDQEVTYEARTRIILCAGTIRTPGILERSGYGDPVMLQNLNVPLLVPNPHVGAHIKNHTVIALIVNVPQDGNVSAGLSQNGFFGPISMNYLLPLSQTRIIETLSLPAGFGSIAGRCTDSNILLGIPPSFNPGGDSGILFGFFCLKTDAVGSIHIADQSINFPPALDYIAFTTPNDDTIILTASKYINAAVKSAAIATGKNYYTIYPPAGPPSSFPIDYFDGAHDSDLLYLMKSTAFDAGHWMCSCRMGSSILNSVVNSNLHVHGVSNLMIADNSVWPDAAYPDGNTCYAAYYIGKRAAQIIAAL